MRIFLVIVAAMLVAVYGLTRPRAVFDAGLVRESPAAVITPAGPWAREGRTATLQAGETITEIIIASPVVEALDIRCLRHVYGKQVSLVCPGVSQDDMQGISEDVGP